MRGGEGGVGEGCERGVRGGCDRGVRGGESGVRVV